VEFLLVLPPDYILLDWWNSDERLSRRYHPCYEAMKHYTEKTPVYMENLVRWIDGEWFTSNEKMLVLEKDCGIKS
jgi:hypothetical protein